MARHRKFDLLDQVVQAANESGFNVLYVSDIKDHPFVLRIYNENESYLLRIYIWNLTHGGGSARPANEYRIQFTGVSQFEQRQDERTLILGWWEQIGIFAGFDLNRRKDGRVSKSPSAQIREGNLQNALANGFSACDRGNGEIAIAFRPDFFGDYVRNLADLHQLGENPKEIEVIEKIASGSLKVNSAEILELPKKRQIIYSTLSKKFRERGFTRRVLKAYSHQCAFSGMQLKLVDAAHIIPVSDPTSTDETSNGLALSPLYHRAFDNGLVTLNDNYQIIVNEKRLSHLHKIGFDNGMDAFKNLLRPDIIVPTVVSDRPNINFIREANKLRGW
jgi:putative restriction endonuclease